MSKYTFTAYADRKFLGTVVMQSNKLPNHLEICLEIVQAYPDATEYNWEDLGLTPIDLSRYVPHEFLCVMKQANYKWIGKHLEYITGFHKGEKGEILNYTQDRDGSRFSLQMESGAYATIGITEIKNTILID